MSLRIAAAGCLSLALLGAAATPSAPRPTRFELHARSVIFDLDARTATAVGKAVLTTQSYRIDAETVAFDLRADAFVADGDVAIRCASGTAHVSRLKLAVRARYGAALATPQAKPQRFDALTCALADDAHAAAVPAPGKPATRSILAARRVDIVADSYIHLYNPTFGVGPGAIRLPSYSIELGDGYAVQQPAPSAAADPIIGVIGSSDSLTDVRLRVDPHSGIGAGFTERIFTTTRETSAVEVSTADIGLRADLLQSWQISPHLHESLTAAAFKGYVGGRFGIDGTIGAFPISDSVVQNTDFETGDFIIATPHELLGRRGSFVREWVDLGYDRSPGQAVPFDERATAGILFDSGSFRGPLATQIDVSADARTAFFNDGERHEIADLSFSVTEPVSRRFRLTESAIATPALDRFPGGVTPLADPNAYVSPISDPLFIPTNSGVNVTGMLRSLTLLAHYEPRPGITLETSLTRAFDSVASTQTVRPPFSGWYYVHMETPSHFGIEIGRSDLFGWQGVHMAPNYTLRITTPR